MTLRSLALSSCLLLALSGCGGLSGRKAAYDDLPGAQAISLPVEARIAVYAFRLRQAGAHPTPDYWVIHDDPRVQARLIASGEFPFLRSDQDLRIELYGVWTFKGQPVAGGGQALALSRFLKASDGWVGELSESRSQSSAESYRVMLEEQAGRFTVKSIQFDPTGPST